MTKRILVIDDDEFVRKSFKLALNNYKYYVDTAESGEAGVKMQKNQGYDLIFLDLNMLGMNGIETLRHLRDIDKENYIYIITAFDNEYLRELKNARFERLEFELFNKPLERKKIIALTDGLFGGPTEYI